MPRFTARMIDALPKKATRYEVWEGGGFGIRVSPNGGKSWVFLYRHDDRPRRMTLGRYPETGLADAHVALAAARKRLEQGIDPGAQVVEQHRAQREAETVAELIERYLSEYAYKKKRSAAEDERMLRKEVMPAWGRRKAKDITRKDGRALVNGIADRGAPIGANRSLAVIRRMFNWAVEEEILDANPITGIKAPGVENQRDRVLTASEIASLWHQLSDDTLRISKSIRLALKFQLVTAQRKGEVISAEWSEFDGAVWTIPANKAKNGLAHRVPLSRLALDVLAEAGKRTEGFVFTSPHGPITASVVDHAMRDRRDRLGPADATPHDLRRTAASHMTSVGISRLVVSKILNHAEPGVTAVYDRHSYDAEKRYALEAWAIRLEEIVTGTTRPSNVTALRA